MEQAKHWTIEQRVSVGERFAFVDLFWGTEDQAIAEARALLMGNGGSAVEVRFSPMGTLGSDWIYLNQDPAALPVPAEADLSDWPEWLSPGSDWTEAGAEALRKRRMAQFSRHRIYCEVCGAEFGARRRTARFCSSRCRQLAYRRRQGSSRSTPIERAEAAQKGISTKRDQSIRRRCHFCEAEFWIDGTQTAALYCSPRCKQAAYRERKRAERIADEAEFLSKSERG